MTKSARILIGVDCQELLAAMNKRIRFLLDREHQIGHTYFMDVKEDYGQRFSCGNLQKQDHSAVAGILLR